MKSSSKVLVTDFRVQVTPGSAEILGPELAELQCTLGLRCRLALRGHGQPPQPTRHDWKGRQKESVYLGARRCKTQCMFEYVACY